MNTSLERKALAVAILAALTSLGSAALIAGPIEHLMTAIPSAADITTPAVPPSPRTASAEQTTTATTQVALVTQSSSAPMIPLATEGSHYFGQSCGDCHGDDAHGDEGPDLHSLAISNSRITATIHNGVKGEMPSFAKKYNDHQIAALVAYVRSLK